MMMDLGLDIAQSLTAIVTLYRDLEDEALHRFADSEMPGGDALNYLGPVANMEAYGYRQLNELMGRSNLKAGYDDPETDDAPPLLVLGSWRDIIWDHRNLPPATAKATITSEADAIRASLDWMMAEDHDGMPNFLPADELAKDLRRVRARLENVLKAGERADRIRAECKSCPPSPRLCVEYGGPDGESDDSWYCPNCRAPYDVEGVRTCWRQMFVKHGDAPDWLTLRNAATATNRAPSTIRSWTLAPVDGLGNPKLDKAGEPTPPRVESEKRDDGRTWVNWPDVRAVEDTIQRRNRKRNAA